MKRADNLTITALFLIVFTYLSPVMQHTTGCLYSPELQPIQRNDRRGIFPNKLDKRPHFTAERGKSAVENNPDNYRIFAFNFS